MDDINENPYSNSLEPELEPELEPKKAILEASVDNVYSLRKNFLDKKLDEYEKKKEKGESLSDRDNFLIFTNTLYTEPGLNEALDEDGATIASEMVEKIRNISTESGLDRKNKMDDFIEYLNSNDIFKEIKVSKSNFKDYFTENIDSVVNFMDEVKEKSKNKKHEIPEDEVYKNLGQIEKRRLNPFFSLFDREKGIPSRKGVEFISNYETLLDMYDKPEDKKVIFNVFNTAAKNQDDSLNLKKQIRDTEEKLNTVMKTPETATGNAADVGAQAAIVGGTAAAVAFPPALIVMCIIYILYHSEAAKKEGIKPVKTIVDKLSKKIDEKMSAAVKSVEKFERKKQVDKTNTAIADATKKMSEIKNKTESSIPSNFMPLVPVSKKYNRNNFRQINDKKIVNNQIDDKKIENKQINDKKIKDEPQTLKYLRENNNMSTSTQSTNSPNSSKDMPKKNTTKNIELSH
ncbi:MAG: hypothetical protein LBP39_01960 [Rickettsiales bacterium]|jgi:hypothetical protein|nr:hypothetical protein [Rickettsiales bacterium]